MKFSKIKTAVTLLFLLNCLSGWCKDIVLPSSMEYVSLEIGGDSLPGDAIMRRMPSGLPGIVSGTLGVEFNDSTVIGRIRLPFAVTQLEFEQDDPMLFYARGRELGYFDVNTGAARELFSAPDPVVSMAPFADGVYYSCGNRIYLNDFDSDTVLCVVEMPAPVTKIRTVGGDLYISYGKQIVGLTTGGHVIPVCNCRENITDFDMSDDGVFYCVTPTRLLMVRPGNKIMPVLGEPVRQLLSLDGGLYLILNDGSLGKVRLRSGRNV